MACALSSVPVRWLVFLGAVVALPRTVAREVSVAHIEPTDLVEYETETPAVKRLIEVSLEFTRKKLGYQFGSNSPSKRGMDCSGTVQATLTRFGLENLPRSSYDFYLWAKEKGELVPTPDVETTEDPVFERLRPGDFLFWKGTYSTKGREPAISHVMIYLGTLKSDGSGVVFGASDGRYFRGRRLSGVSVFDWEVPGKGSKSKFVAYGPIPGLREATPEPPKIEAPGLKSLLENLFKKREPSPP